jgi:hypothetical protein
MPPKPSWQFCPRTLIPDKTANAIDFWFVPNPKTFAMYVTFFANKKSGLTAIFDAFSAHGVNAIENYERKL